MGSDNIFVHIRIIAERGFGPIMEMIGRTVISLPRKYLRKVVGYAEVVCFCIIVPGRIVDAYKVIFESYVKTVFGFFVIGIKTLDIFHIVRLFNGFVKLIAYNDVSARAANNCSVKRLPERNDIDCRVEH